MKITQLIFRIIDLGWSKPIRSLDSSLLGLNMWTRKWNTIYKFYSRVFVTRLFFFSTHKIKLNAWSGFETIVLFDSILRTKWLYSKVKSERLANCVRLLSKYCSRLCKVLLATGSLLFLSGSEFHGKRTFTHKLSDWLFLSHMFRFVKKQKKVTLALVALICSLSELHFFKNLESTHGSN